MPITFHDISSQIHTYQKQCRLPLTFQCHLYNSNIVVLFDSNCRGGFCSNPCTCGSGTPCHCPRAYKACVGRISCRCGTKVSSPKGENPDLPRRLKTKTLRAWLPKEDNKLAGV